MFGFSQVLKPIKWQYLLEKEKNGSNEFQTDAKIHFSEENVWGQGHFKKFGIGYIIHTFVFTQYIEPRVRT